MALHCSGTPTQRAVENALKAASGERRVMQAEGGARKEGRGDMGRVSGLTRRHGAGTGALSHSTESVLKTAISGCRP